MIKLWTIHLLGVFSVEISVVRMKLAENVFPFFFNLYILNFFLPFFPTPQNYSISRAFIRYFSWAWKRKCNSGKNSLKFNSRFQFWLSFLYWQRKWFSRPAKLIKLRRKFDSKASTNEIDRFVRPCWLKHELQTKP